MFSNKSIGCGYNLLVGVLLLSRMFVFIQLVVIRIIEEVFRVFFNVKRKSFKYNLFNFVSTVRYMCKKLYKVVGIFMFIIELFEEKGIFVFWKVQLLKEYWFINKKVSVFLISRQYYFVINLELLVWYRK